MSCELLNQHPTPDLNELIGTTVIINPQRLMNKKRLYTTQNWVDSNKLTNAMKGLPSIENEPPSCYVSYEKSDLVYIIGDGNHRVALKCINGEEIPLTIREVWDTKRHRYGFNKIVGLVRNILNGLIDNDCLEI